MRHSRFIFSILALGFMVGLTNAQTTLTFQQGVGGYSDCFDRLIGSGADVDGSAVDTTGSSFFIDGDPTDSSRKDYLIRFDNIVGGSGIPANAIILDATLTLTGTSGAVSTSSQSGESYNIYRLIQAFDSNSTLDGDFGDGDGLFTSFIDGAEPEDGEVDFNVGTFDHIVGGFEMGRDEPITADVTRAVQSWVNGDPNLGLAIMSDHTDNDDGWSVHSTGSSDVASRPILEVTYTTDPDLKVIELQQGLNEYNGTFDRFLNQIDFGIDGSTVSEGFLDGLDNNDPPNPEASPDAPYMVRFDLTGVGEIEEVCEAYLILKTGISSGASDSGGATDWGVHQMLVPFDQTSEWFNFSGFYDDMVTAGEIDPVTGFFTDIDEAELVKVDVTPIVKNWLENGDTNHGIYIGSHGTDNGWQIFSSGAVDQDLAPMLRLIVKCPPSFIPGDMNDDGMLDFDDLDLFVLALFDRAAFDALGTGIDADARGDFNGDGVLNFDDLDLFVNALFGA